MTIRARGYSTGAKWERMCRRARRGAFVHIQEFSMLESFIDRLRSAPDTIRFPETIALIDALYEFTPTAFRNGDVRNEAGQNSGSCKIFAFAQLQSTRSSWRNHCSETNSVQPFEAQ